MEDGSNQADFEHSVEQTLSTLGATRPIEPVKSVSLTDKLAAIASSQGFDVESLLGRGGMGAVMLARDRQLGRKVALKFLAIPSLATDDSLQGLRREAERAGNLAHENVVQIYSWHSVGTLTFFAMEYVDGDTVQQFVQRESRIALTEILRVMAEACSGVAAAHDAGILHRDIKPGNILISRTGRVKVADFGLASTDQEERRRRSEKISGTLGFMAPEQARGESVLPASDVYGLAATLYYCLAKVTPYGSINNARTMLARNQAGDHNPLEKVKPGLPPALYRLVERGLSPEVEKRFENAKVFRREIEQAMLLLNEKTIPKEKTPSRMPAWLSPLPLAIGFGAGLLVGALAVWAFINFV